MVSIVFAILGYGAWAMVIGTYASRAIVGVAAELVDGEMREACFHRTRGSSESGASSRGYRRCCSTALPRRAGVDVRSSSK